jgi:hypothetical protein
METKVLESGINRIQRTSFKSLSIFFICFGILFTSLQILSLDLILSLIGIPNIILGFYLNRRIIKIKTFKDDIIIFDLGKEEVELHVKDILSISKMVRITFTKRFWMIITCRKNNSKYKERYFVMNEPDYNFLERFKEMGIYLKNLP